VYWEHKLAPCSFPPFVFALTAIVLMEECFENICADRLETPLTLLKNTAYTRGFKSHIGEPIANFVVKR
jgi:hypothetical protein